jgi:hypothetical protein
MLRDEYPGDAAWERYADAVNNRSDGRLDSPMLEGLDRETSNVIFALAGEEGPSWWMSPILALDNRSPSAVFRENQAGRQILRTLLMRFP